MNTFIILVYTFWVCDILYILGKDIVKHGQEKKQYSLTVNLVSYACSIFIYTIMGLFESPINFYKWFIILLVVATTFTIYPSSKPTKHNGFVSVVAMAFVLFIYYKAGMFDKFFALVNF